MSKNELPNWVKKYIEKRKIVKVKNGKYYLYEHTCLYDKTRKHKNYVKDIYIGRITEDNGLILANKLSKVLPMNLYSKEYGQYLLFIKLCNYILTRLTTFFGEKYGTLIFIIACLRVQENTQYSELSDVFQSSFFSTKYNNYSMSKTYLSDFFFFLSKYKTNMTNFMKEDIEDEDILVFDGTNILCGGQNISYVGFGYNHGHNYPSQIGELYAYSPKTKKPVFFKMLEGSVSDKATLKDVIKEFDVKNAIALIDNGFESDSNITRLLLEKNKFIMALKRSSKLVPEEVLNDYSREKAKEVFIDNGEAVYGYETLSDNYRICIFFNKAIEAVDTTEYIDKINKSIQGYNQENFLVAKKRFGIYALKTNIEELSLKNIYEYYKSRFEVEFMFDTIKNTLGFDKSYMHSDNSIEAWAFINHISIMITQKIYDYLKEKDVNISLHQLFKKLRQVKVIINNLDKSENYELQGIPKKTRELLEKIDIS